MKNTLISTVAVLAAITACSLAEIRPLPPRFVRQAHSLTANLPASNLETNRWVSIQWSYTNGWQTNGISFNVVANPPIFPYPPVTTWTILTNVSALSVKLYTDPTVWFAVIATNRNTGMMTTDFIAPVGVDLNATAP
jgi:hypothetical protein